jgi:hypothetical protein
MPPAVTHETAASTRLNSKRRPERTAAGQYEDGLKDSPQDDQNGDDAKDAACSAKRILPRVRRD